MRAVIALAACVVLSVATASANAQTVDPAAGQPARTGRAVPDEELTPRPSGFAAGLARWVDFETAEVSIRYRHLDPSTSAPTADQLQVNEGLRARFKFDAPGRYGVVLNATSGSGFLGGWDTTGIGTGQRDLDFFVRHLYLDARPTRALTVQIGSLPAARGQFTERIGLDNDAYIAGERLTLRSPAHLYFDEVVLTTGYVGDLSSPDFFDRRDRFDQVNYYQAVLSKRFGRRTAASLDYTDLDDVRTLSGAVRIETPGLGVVRGLRYEQYVPMNRDASSGFALAAETLFPAGGRAEAGITHIDRRLRPLNGDRYGLGTRVFGSVSMPLSTSLTASTFATYAFTSSYGLPNKVRLDMILTWNILGELRRHGVVK